MKAHSSKGTQKVHGVNKPRQRKERSKSRQTRVPLSFYRRLEVWEPQCSFCLFCIDASFPRSCARREIYRGLHGEIQSRSILHGPGWLRRRGDWKNFPCCSLSTVSDNTEEGNLREDSIARSADWYARNVSTKKCITFL